MKILLYCTKAKPYLYHDEDYCFDTMNTIDLGYKTFEYTNQRVYDDETGKFLGWEKYGNMYKDYALNGKIVAECDFEVEDILHTDNCISYYCKKTTLLKEKSCLTDGQIYSYLKGKNGYAIHIKNLHIFDKPRELSYYYRYCPCSYNPLQPIKVAPQNMMYAYNFKDYDEKPEYILISIRPEWLCKILNSEKTIEVRKKVLKEMLNNE